MNFFSLWMKLRRYKFIEDAAIEKGSTRFRLHGPAWVKYGKKHMKFVCDIDPHSVKVLTEEQADV